eukprot:gene36437-44200_t
MEEQTETPRNSNRVPSGKFSTRGSSDAAAAKSEKDSKIKNNIAKYSAALSAIKVEHAEPADKLEKFRLACKKYMSSSSFGYFFELTNVLVSLLSTAQCIYFTYLDVDNPAHEKPLQIGRLLAILFAAFFIADWFFEWFLADHKYLYIFSFSSLVDMISVITIFLTLPHDPPQIKRDATVLQITLYCVVFLLFFAAIMQYLESSFSPFGFHTWLFYIWVTVATVGYGDITPHSTPGQMAAIVIIGFAIISVPKVTNELIAKMKLQSVFMRASYVPKTTASKHVIICGDVSSTSLRNFFEELFHEDHDSGDLSAVILLPIPPTVEIILLMREPKYSLSLVYLEGSALVESDLRRAKAEIAKAIFIMTNKFAANPDEEDAKSILLNLSIKRYLSYYDREGMLYCTQLIRPENRRHLSKNDANELDENDLVVCLNEIKMGAMAKAVVCPGANTLIMNLVTSFSDSALGGGNDSSTKTSSWLDEYQKGCDWEIYTTSLSSIFENANFAELSFALYEKYGVVLFALQIADLKDPDSQPRLLLNPAEFHIPSQKEFSVKAFVIAKNQASSDLTFSDLEEDNSVNSLTRFQRNIGTIVQTQAKQYQDAIANRKASLMSLAGLGLSGNQGMSMDKAAEK